MKQSSEKVAVEKLEDKFLEYTGKTGRTFRDLPVVKNGSIVKVAGKLVESLLATKLFKMSTQEAAEKLAKQTADKKTANQPKAATKTAKES